MSDKGSTDPKQILDGGATEESGEIEEGPIKTRDFFWDSIILYLVSVILALAAVDALIEFIRGSEVSCITSDGQDTGDYVTNFCSSSIPISQYVPGFIFIHGLAISIPHYLWAANSNGQFDTFLSIVTSLDRFREQDTGKYSKKNFNLIHQLEQSFTTYGRNSIFYLYLGKLILQLILAFASFVISVIFFTDFDAVFYCPRDNNTDYEFWPLSTRVTCVFQSLRLLYWIRLIDMIILVFIILSVVLALWFCASGHPNELGGSQIARFSFESGLKPSYYIPFSRFCPRCFTVLTRYISSPFVSPRISNDLDFLLLKLFSSSASLGQVFKEVQIDRTMQLLMDDDYLITRRHNSKWFTESEKDLALPVGDLKWIFKEKPKPQHSGKEDITIGVPASVRGAILGLSSLSLFLPDKKMRRTQPYHGALVITFNQSGLALGLARVFRRVGSIWFTEFKRTIEEDADLLNKLIDVEPQLSGVIDVTAPENILVAKTDLSALVHKRLETIWRVAGTKFIKSTFIVVGPMTERQATRTSLFLNLLSSAVIKDDKSNITMSYLREGCVLVTLKPVTISGKNVTEQFCGLEKPLPNFRPIQVGLRGTNDKITWPPQEVTSSTQAEPFSLEEDSVPMTTVNPQTKVDIDSETRTIIQNLTCGNIHTTFEIDVYKYVVPSLISTKEAESMQTKDKGASDESKGSKEVTEVPVKGLEEPKKDIEGIVLEKTSNEEQAKMNQSIVEDS